jgi:hypothetical protein
VYLVEDPIGRGRRHPPLGAADDLGFRARFRREVEGESGSVRQAMPDTSTPTRTRSIPTQSPKTSGVELSLVA